MIDLQNEKIFPFTELPARLQEKTSSKQRVHIATAHRWRQRGIQGIRLKTALIGGQLVTSHEAVNRFVEATT